jgi:hypothetical protein
MPSHCAANHQPEFETDARPPASQPKARYLSFGSGLASAGGTWPPLAVGTVRIFSDSSGSTAPHRTAPHRPLLPRTRQADKVGPPARMVGHQRPMPSAWCRGTCTSHAVHGGMYRRLCAARALWRWQKGPGLGNGVRRASRREAFPGEGRGRGRGRGVRGDHDDDDATCLRYLRHLRCAHARLLFPWQS